MTDGISRLRSTAQNSATASLKLNRTSRHSCSHTARHAIDKLYKELLELVARRYAVRALDLRGHGASAGAIAGWSWRP